MSRLRCGSATPNKRHDYRRATIAWALIFCGYALTSAITFAAYGLDKRSARLGRRRIPERPLHGLELLGGWPGALLGQAVFHHKRRKLSYMVVFVGIVAILMYLSFAKILHRDDVPETKATVH